MQETSTRSPTRTFFTPGADLVDGADGLVAEDPAVGDGGHVAFEDVQVGAADRHRVDAHDRVGVVLDDRVRDFLPALVARVRGTRERAWRLASSFAESAARSFSTLVRHLDDGLPVQPNRAVPWPSRHAQVLSLVGTSGGRPRRNARSRRTSPTPTWPTSWPSRRSRSRRPTPSRPRIRPSRAWSSSGSAADLVRLGPAGRPVAFSRALGPADSGGKAIPARRQRQHHGR